MNSFPTQSEALNILRLAGCSKRVIQHCKKVAELAICISTALSKKGIEINLKVVEVGALLHDIGRSKTHSVLHGYYGGKIASSLDLPKPIVKIIERHVGAGIPASEGVLLGLPKKDFIPLTIEEKIVASADKLVSGPNIIDGSDAVKELEKDLTKNHPAVVRLKGLLNELSIMHGEIFAYPNSDGKSSER
ncbi:MAG: HDIG domain-containing metalloprotein [Candidatus Bathyarchaeota archaeon]